MDKTFLTTVLLAVLVSGALAICAPDCSESNKGDTVEDPMDCHNYYLCQAPGVPADAPAACPDGNNYIPSLGTCGPGDCSSTCATSCRLSCSLEGSNIIADPFDCGVYSGCLLGSVAVTCRCPDDLPYFDGNNCVKDENRCCTPFCTPYCYPGAVEVPDPHDCKSYYICVDGKLSNDTHRTCDNGEVFDIIGGRCTAQAECVTLCDSRGGGAPTSTTSSASCTVPSDTTTTTTTSSGCTESPTCTMSGSFPWCEGECSQTYYSCSGPGMQWERESCNEGFLFNPNPAFPTCVAANLCPFYPRK